MLKAAWMNKIAMVFLVCFSQMAVAMASQTALEHLQIYRENRQQAVFENSINNLPQAQKNLVRELLYGIYLIDFGHAAPELLEMFMGQKSLNEMTFPFRYNSPGQNALLAFSEARRFLINRRKPLSLELIKQVHVLAFPWANDFGEGPDVFRRRFVYGPEFADGLYPVQIKSINDNPYLHFMPATDVFADVPQHPEKAQRGERTLGAIVYPRLRDVKPAVLDRLRPLFPDLVARVQQYQSQYGNTFENKSEALTQELVNAMLSERIQNFENEQRALSDLSHKGELEKYIRLIAEFQRDFVSIHPFADGNGRTSRLLLYYLAERKNLPAPRIVYPNEDLFWTASQWEEEIFNGMIASTQMQAAILNQLKNHLPVEKSIALLTPALPADNNLKPFEDFFKRRLGAETQLKNQFLMDPPGTLRSIEAQYQPNAR